MEFVENAEGSNKVKAGPLSVGGTCPSQTWCGVAIEWIWISDFIISSMGRGITF